MPRKYRRIVVSEEIEDLKERTREIKATALRKQQLENHIAYHIKKNQIETDRLLEEDRVVMHSLMDYR